jgi:hypothetical protein
MHYVRCGEWGYSVDDFKVMRKEVICLHVEGDIRGSGLSI